MTAGLELLPLAIDGEISPGDDLAALVHGAVSETGRRPADGDALVVCQKVVSKVEGRLVPLASVEPSALARAFAAEHDKDARVVELVLREARRVVRMVAGVLLCETRHGWVCANAGVDLSNAPGPDVAVLLPEDPDASARRLRAALGERFGWWPATVVSDTFGRPWREGQVDVAIGVAGFAPVASLDGRPDRVGRALRVTAPAVADMLAAAAGLLMEKAASVPAVWIRGASLAADESATSAPLRRPPERDLFR